MAVDYIHKIYLFCKFSIYLTYKYWSLVDTDRCLAHDELFEHGIYVTSFPLIWLNGEMRLSHLRPFCFPLPVYFTVITMPLAEAERDPPTYKTQLISFTNFPFKVISAQNPLSPVPLIVVPRAVSSRIKGYLGWDHDFLLHWIVSFYLLWIFFLCQNHPQCQLILLKVVSPAVVMVHAGNHRLGFKRPKITYVIWSLQKLDIPL